MTTTTVTARKVFAGEYACHDHGNRMKWNHAGASIYEAAFMTTLERNADIVHMATYARFSPTWKAGNGVPT